MKSHEIPAALAVVTSAVAAIRAAQARTYPAKPIYPTVSRAARGNADFVGHPFGQRLAERLDQQVVADKRSGAASVARPAMVVRASSDGYTPLRTRRCSHQPPLASTPPSTQGCPTIVSAISRPFHYLPRVQPSG
jgi:tripartite-type tricarboxylate transporter receptor subunit TctC